MASEEESIDFNGAKVAYMNSVTINASELSNMNSDGVRYGYLTGNTVFENSTFTANGDGVYAFHIDGVNGGGTATLTFNKCTFTGWTTVGEDVTSITFTDCIFADGAAYNQLNSVQNMTFINCTFGSNFNIDDESSENQTWSFINCTGVPAKLNATGSYKTVTTEIN